MPYNILVPYFTRSEYGPLEPLFKKAEQRPFDEQVKLLKADFRGTDFRTLQWGGGEEEDIDMVLCGFDRPEMAEYAYHVYHLNKGGPIAQIFAGDIAGGAYDDRDRFVISNYSDLIFTAGEKQASRVMQAVRWRREVNDLPLVINSGATHYDDMTTKPFLDFVFDKAFALVLYNRPSLLTIDKMMVELKEMGDWLTQHYANIYWAMPNGDEGSEGIMDFAHNLRNTHMLPQMRREWFLWVLSKAAIFAGNSSALFYEAPHFKTPIKQFGMRNHWRETPDDTKPGASACILSNIYKFLERRK